VTLEYRRADNSLATNTITVGQTYRVKIVAKDASGCTIPVLRIQNLTTNRTDLVTVTRSSFVQDEFTVTAKAADLSHPILTARVDNINFTSTLFVKAARLVVSPASLVLAPGSGTRVRVDAYDHEGRLIPAPGLSWNPAPVWSTDASSVATVRGYSDGTADVAGVAMGTTSIRVNHLGGQASATVKVQSFTVASVEISPSGWFVLTGIGTPLQFTAVVKNAQGDVIPGKTVVWSTSNSAYGTVSQSGLVTALSENNFTVQAVVDGVEGTQLVMPVCPLCHAQNPLG
jgi:hypothetical protein